MSAPSGSTKLDIIYGIDDIPPKGECVALGLQHYLTMFGSTVAIPLMMAGPLGISEDPEKLGWLIGSGPSRGRAGGGIAGRSKTPEEYSAAPRFENRRRGRRRRLSKRRRCRRLPLPAFRESSMRLRFASLAVALAAAALLAAGPEIGRAHV